MKKLLRMLTVFLVIISLSSCDSSIFGLGLKLEGQKLISEAIEPTQEELDQMFIDKEDFIIYVYSPNCSTCNDFTDILNQVIWDNSLCIYKVTLSIARNDDYINLDADAIVPALVAVKGGSVKNTTLYTESSEYFVSTAGLLDYLNKIAEMPTFEKGIVDISYEQFLTLKSQETSFLLYVNRSGSSDCTYLNSFYWNNFVSKYSYDVDFYVLNAQDLYEEQLNTPDSTVWDDAKAQLGLTAYLDGKVPSFVYYSEGVYTDMAVVFNDVYTWETDDQYSYWTMTITQSYWGESSKLIGTEYTATTKAEAYNTYRTLTVGYHANKLNEFIKQYITQVD